MAEATLDDVLAELRKLHDVMERADKAAEDCAAALRRLAAPPPHIVYGYGSTDR